MHTIFILGSTSWQNSRCFDCLHALCAASWGDITMYDCLKVLLFLSWLIINNKCN